MQIHYRLSAVDQRILVERGRAGFSLGRWGRFLWICVLTALLAGWARWRLETDETAGWRAAELFGVAGLFVLAYGLDVAWRRFGAVDLWLERFAGDYSLNLTPAGFAVSREGRHDFVAWPEIGGFEETPRHWVLHPGAGRGIVVPKSALPLPEDQQRFAAEIRQAWAEHPGNRGRSLAAGPPGPLLSPRVWRDLADNLRAGYRLAVFRQVEPSDFRPGAIQIALLLLLQLLLYAAADYLLAGADSRFNAYGLTDFGTVSLLFLLGGIAMAGRLSETGSLRLLWVAIAAAELPIYSIYAFCYGATGHLETDAAETAATLLYLLWLAWTLAIAFRCMVRLCGYPRAVAFLPVSFFALFNLALAHGLPEEELFDPPPDRVAANGEPAVDAEDLIYRQPALVDTAVAQLAADRVGMTDLYFVGFAGQADEKVFAHEIVYVKDLFDRRYGTAERSLALVNSLETADALPLANAHNLDAALQKLARRMNRKEDVLFLYLSSHGSEDHHLGVQFPTLPLNDLSATRLKDILDDSGIRHRVIVISACYSGGFLDVLKDDDSLIVTAASRDRPSFGCGTDSEFTYFGNAYFVEALNETPSFVDAFEAARSRIEAREKSEGKPPSLPQVHVGPGILPKLRQLEQRVAARS